jgi:hypothetical protein
MQFYGQRSRHYRRKIDWHAPPPRSWCAFCNGATCDLRASVFGENEPDRP